jgi:hypothetical protein
MTAVGCVVRNRMLKHSSSYFTEVTKRLQFSSITAPGDPQLTVFPTELDAIWKLAQSVAALIVLETTPDTTNGSTMYYAPKALTGGNVAPTPIEINGVDRPFPKGWDRTKVKFEAVIGNQIFFSEVV